MTAVTVRAFDIPCLCKLRWRIHCQGTRPILLFVHVLARRLIRWSPATSLLSTLFFERTEKKGPGKKSLSGKRDLEVYVILQPCPSLFHISHVLEVCSACRLEFAMRVIRAARAVNGGLFSPPHSLVSRAQRLTLRNNHHVAQLQGTVLRTRLPSAAPCRMLTTSLRLRSSAAAEAYVFSFRCSSWAVRGSFPC